MTILPNSVKSRLRALKAADLRLTERLRLRTTRSGWWLPAVILAHSGDSWLWATGIGLVWLLRIGGEYWHHLATVLEISIVIQALAVFALKAVIRRRRPEGQWGGIYRQYDPHSFPSGHATRAMLLAVLGLALGPAWFGTLLAVWAPLVCLSRVMTGVHYASDIVGGMVLGLAMGAFMAVISPFWQQVVPFLFALP